MATKRDPGHGWLRGGTWGLGIMLGGQFEQYRPGLASDLGWAAMIICGVGLLASFRWQIVRRSEAPR